MTAESPQSNRHANQDPLLQAVVWLCAHHGQPRSAQSLLSGLGIDQLLTPPLAVRMLQEAGFKAALVKRDPATVMTLLLPVVLLLRGGDACVLLGREGQGKHLRFKVLMPAQGPDEAPVEVMATADELLGEYSGYTLIATPQLAMEHVGHEAADELLAMSGQHWFWGTIKRFIPYYRGAMLAALLSNVLMVFIGLFTSVVYDRVIPHQAFVTLWSCAAGALLAICFDLVARQLRGHLLDMAGKKADLAVGAMLFRKALGVRMESRPESAGSFAHHLGQMEIVRDFFTSASMAAISDLPFIFLYVGMIWFIGGEVVLVMVLGVPIILGLAFGLQAVMRRAMRANQKQLADMHGLLIESVEGMEAIRVAGAQGYFQKQYEQANALAADSSLRARGITNVMNNVTMIMQQLVTVSMLVWGVHLIQEGKLTGGALISAVMFAGRAVAPLASVVALTSRYQGARVALKMLNELMAQPSERDPGKQYLTRAHIAGQLGLREVSFGYPSGPDQTGPMVLKQVTLRIAAGERVAILGKIGSGKSTALRLLAGLYQPTEGATEVDGIDLRQIDPADYRAHIGFVSQEPRLFRGSLRDNILLGRYNADPATLAEVCAQTGLDRIAAAHPLGMDMPVGEGGSMLSGGQRQLVALARCLVTRPQVVLMDEPTSSMDAQTETVFLQHLQALMKDRTLVVVTHRPALLQVVERIVVFDAGKLIIDGPKQQVLAHLSGQQQPAAAPAAQAAGRAPLSVVQ